MGEIVHVVLSKIKPNVPDSFTQEYAKKAMAMRGQIPGLTAVKAGTCLEGSKHRTQGFTHMLYSTFDNEESLRKYATHPVHVELQNFVAEHLTDKVVFDLEL